MPSIEDSSSIASADAAPASTSIDDSLAGLKSPRLQRSQTEPPPLLCALHNGTPLPMPFSPALLDTLAHEMSTLALETFGFPPRMKLKRSQSEPMGTNPSLKTLQEMPDEKKTDEKTMEGRELKVDEIKIQVCSVCYDPLLAGGPVLCGNVDCQQICSACLVLLFEEKVKSSRGSAPIIRCPGPDCVMFLPFTTWSAFVSPALKAQYIKNAEDMLTLQCSNCHQRGTLLKKTNITDARRAEAREKLASVSPQLLAVVDSYCRFEISVKDLLENKVLFPLLDMVANKKEQLAKLTVEMQEYRDGYIHAMATDKELKELHKELSNRGKFIADMRRRHEATRPVSPYLSFLASTFSASLTASPASAAISNVISVASTAASSYLSDSSSSTSISSVLSAATTYFSTATTSDSYLSSTVPPPSTSAEIIVAQPVDSSATSHSQTAQSQSTETITSGSSITAQAVLVESKEDEEKKPMMRNAEDIPLADIPTVLVQEEKLVAQLKVQHKAARERIKALYPFKEQGVLRMALQKDLKKYGRDNDAPIHAVIDDLLTLIEDVERRAALYLRYCLMFPQVKSLCCSRAHCFKCKVVSHSGPCERQNIVSDVKRCPKCNIGLVKGDGCDSITCICGERFNWQKAQTSS